MESLVEKNTEREAAAVVAVALRVVMISAQRESLREEVALEGEGFN